MFQMFNTARYTNSKIVPKIIFSPITKSVADGTYRNQHDHPAPTYKEIIQSRESPFKTPLI